MKKAGVQKCGLCERPEADAVYRLSVTDVTTEKPIATMACCAKCVANVRIRRDGILTCNIAPKPLSGVTCSRPTALARALEDLA